MDEYGIDWEGLAADCDFPGLNVADLDNMNVSTTHYQPDSGFTNGLGFRDGFDRNASILDGFTNNFGAQMQSSNGFTRDSTLGDSFGVNAPVSHGTNSSGTQMQSLSGFTNNLGFGDGSQAPATPARKANIQQQLPTPPSSNHTPILKPVNNPYLPKPKRVVLNNPNLMMESYAQSQMPVLHYTNNSAAQYQPFMSSTQSFMPMGNYAQPQVPLLQHTNYSAAQYQPYMGSTNYIPPIEDYAPQSLLQHTNAPWDNKQPYMGVTNFLAEEEIAPELFPQFFKTPTPALRHPNGSGAHHQLIDLTTPDPTTESPQTGQKHKLGPVDLNAPKPKKARRISTAKTPSNSKITAPKTLSDTYARDKITKARIRSPPKKASAAESDEFKALSAMLGLFAEQNNARATKEAQPEPELESEPEPEPEVISIADTTPEPQLSFYDRLYAVVHSEKIQETPLPVAWEGCPEGYMPAELLQKTRLPLM